ncbi:hypothetical protein [Pseudaminobacter sp. NGMCC 1.201702]|uniref:hypothetical protein n=1 Tax=Pseudaminobacter sp. NGMCC 1.201702 TaxID=3391825 RepID=UPI0039EF9F00
MPDNLRQGVDRRDFIIASVPTVSASVAFAVNAGRNYAIRFRQFDATTRWNIDRPDGANRSGETSALLLTGSGEKRAPAPSSISGRPRWRAFRW